MRTTESGLSSSSGAPSANHDRTLGNIRFWTGASAPRRVLVTRPGVPDSVASHPRHCGPPGVGAMPGTSALSGAA